MEPARYSAAEIAAHDPSSADACFAKRDAIGMKREGVLSDLAAEGALEKSELCQGIRVLKLI